MSALFPSITNTPENAIRSLIVHSMQAEFEAFIAQLEICPVELFNVQPKLGHSVAWHALHIMDWTRCTIQPGLKGVNPILTYCYLGFEQEIWAQAVYGPTLAQEQDSKEKIISVLGEVFFEDSIDALNHAPQERFKAEAMWTTLKQPKPVIAGLMYHVRHIAYHRGQVQQVVNALLVSEAIA